MTHTRFKSLPLDQMSLEQRRIAEQVMSGPRQKLGPALNVLLRSAGVADPVERFGEYARFKSTIPLRLHDFVILLIARHWTAQYPWSVHYSRAVEAGISVSVVDQIAAGQRPTGLQPDEALVYDFCKSLLDGKDVSDATFASIVDKYGECGAVDLIGLMGYYFIITMALVVDRFPPVEGKAPLLLPIA